LVKKNQLLKKYNLKISAFVPAEYKRRAPIKAGLPTLEKHRYLSPLVAAQDLLKLGVDKVYIGDSMASASELEDFAAAAAEITIIPIKPVKKLLAAEEKLLKLTHQNRQDPGEYIIRSQTARKNRENKIEAENNIKRFKYAVTIDNYKYQRYEGDLHILKMEYPADQRINVVADAGKAAVLIEKIKEGEKFKFKIKGDE